MRSGLGESTLSRSWKKVARSWEEEEEVFWESVMKVPQVSESGRS